MKTRVVSHPPAQAEFTWWNLWYFSPLNCPGLLPRPATDIFKFHTVTLPPSLPPRPYRDTGTPRLTNTNIARSHTGLLLIVVEVVMMMVEVLLMMVEVVLMTVLSQIVSND